MRMKRFGLFGLFGFLCTFFFASMASGEKIGTWQIPMPSLDSPEFFRLRTLESEMSSSQSPLVEQLLVKIHSEPEGGRVHDFVAEVDEDFNLINVIRRSGDASHVIPASDMVGQEVVLAETSGRAALLISCVEDCDLSIGGVIQLRYLYNGLMMSYRAVKLRIQLQDSQWRLLTLDGEHIETLRLVSRIVFGRIIGIREIIVNG